MGPYPKPLSSAAVADFLEPLSSPGNGFGYWQYPSVMEPGLSPTLPEATLLTPSVRRPLNWPCSCGTLDRDAPVLLHWWPVPAVLPTRLRSPAWCSRLNCVRPLSPRGPRDLLEPHHFPGLSVKLGSPDCFPRTHCLQSWRRSVAKQNRANSY